MTAITWVLAADGQRARVFETRGLKVDLQQVEDIRNADTPDSEKSRESFAQVIAAFLEQSRRQHRFDRLRLAVDPKFLGVLRECLSSETRELVYEERDTDARSAQRVVERS
ncbi:Protein required for attachment to host cells [Burkholderia sp. 8Y]|uniref:host attachment protein n=1 Tax=Burkholderia sp. 8Y TaxID=2653133 RepID=UPI0012F1D53E|nr:host attachment protein [Burkholderia sp. 8Y]VXB19473.1 Protein required for attachment to host cells [Burkholderia sp. 8Y]